MAKILLTEDDDAVRAFVARALEMDGHKSRSPPQTVRKGLIVCKSMTANLTFCSAISKCHSWMGLNSPK